MISTFNYGFDDEGVALFQPFQKPHQSGNGKGQGEQIQAAELSDAVPGQVRLLDNDRIRQRLHVLP